MLQYLHTTCITVPINIALYKVYTESFTKYFLWR